MKRNIKLKLAIFEVGLTQKEVALQSGVSESLLSMAIRRNYELDHEQKQKISLAVKKSMNEIFE